MQMDRNLNAHPRQCYCFSAPWHPANNLPIPRTDHCSQHRNPFVGISLPRQHCRCLGFGDQLLRICVQEPRLQNPNPLFNVRVHHSQAAPTSTKFPAAPARGNFPSPSLQASLCGIPITNTAPVASS